MIRRMTPRQLEERLAAGTDAPLILDVREDWETRICALPNSLHIPMGQVPMRANELSRDAEIVVVCHHGVRSQRVAYFLQSLGFEKLINLAGGIDAWAKDVDPAMAKY
jgi:rhodanese-related sulfurtransferase